MKLISGGDVGHAECDIFLFPFWAYVEKFEILILNHYFLKLLIFTEVRRTVSLLWLHEQEHVDHYTVYLICDIDLQATEMHTG